MFVRGTAQQGITSGSRLTDFLNQLNILIFRRSGMSRCQAGDDDITVGCSVGLGGSLDISNRYF